MQKFREEYVLKKEQQKLIIVDDNASHLSIVRVLLKSVYEVYPVSSAYKLFDLLEQFIPDLILLDVNMPEMNGFETIVILKENIRYKEIPVVFLTAKDDETSAMRGIDLGAIDYITKPYTGPLLIRRISNILLMEQQKRELQEKDTVIDNLQDQLEQLKK